MSTDEIMKLADVYSNAACALESYLLNSGDYESQRLAQDEARAALLKAIEQLTADAARYRWLRANYDDSLVMYGDNHNCELMMGEVLDSAIDKSMKDETP